jgi:hypothetical protein
MALRSGNVKKISRDASAAVVRKKPGSGFPLAAFSDEMQRRILREEKVPTEELISDLMRFKK